jgi:hypothetical protein
VAFILLCDGSSTCPKDVRFALFIISKPPGRSSRDGGLPPWHTGSNKILKSKIKGELKNED